MSNDSSFSKAYQELQALTAEFEKGDLDLETAIPKFKRAAELAKLLKTRLKQLETQIDEIDIGSDVKAESPEDSFNPTPDRDIEF